MAKQKIQLPKEVDQKINRAIKKILNACAEQMANDCKTQYYKVISEFYADYKPHLYDRTLSTRWAHNMYNKTYKDITTMIDDTTVQIVFSPGSEYIKGKPYRADTDWVFERTYIEGIHGWTPDEVNTIPNNFLGGYNYDSQKHDRYFDIMMGWKNVPEPMSPSPKERMDAWYKEYRKPTNLRQVLQPIAKKILNETM